MTHLHQQQPPFFFFFLFSEEGAPTLIGYYSAGCPEPDPFPPISRFIACNFSLFSLTFYASEMKAVWTFSPVFALVSKKDIPNSAARAVPCSASIIFSSVISLLFPTSTFSISVLPLVWDSNWRIQCLIELNESSLVQSYAKMTQSALLKYYIVIVRKRS